MRTTLNGAEREQSEAFGGVTEDTIVRLSMSEYELNYVLEWIQRMARAYFARDNAQSTHPTYVGRPPPGGRKTCSKTRESFVCVLLGVSLQESKSQHNSRCV